MQSTPAPPHLPHNAYSVHVTESSVPHLFPENSLIAFKPFTGGALHEGRYYDCIEGTNVVIRQVVARIENGERVLYLHTSNDRYKELLPISETIIRGEFLETLTADPNKI